MEDIHLPRHVIDRLEGRWANNLQQAVKTWSDKPRISQSDHVRRGYGRAIPVIVKRSRSTASASLSGARRPHA